MSEIYTYVVVEINYLTSSHIQLRIKPVNEKMDYFSGQYLKLFYPNGEFFPLSIANSPVPSGEIELHIRIVSSDIVAQQLITSLKISSSLIISGPYGKCQYKKTTDDLILLAAGTGFAPAKAIIEHWIESNDLRNCHLYWTVKDQKDFYLPNIPLDWQRNIKRFFYIPIITQSGFQNTKKNKILDAVTSDFCHLDSSQIYIFGPKALAKQALELFTKHGLKKENFFTDMLD